jgi:hypothetical protein
MRAIAFVLVATATLSAGVQTTIPVRWEDTGGPTFGRRDRVLVQGDRLLMAGSGFFPSRSIDGGRSWSRPPERRGLSWEVYSGSDGDVYADAFDGMFRTGDLGDTWTACGQLPADRSTGRRVRSIEAHENACM